jgi:hypothetical protein
VLVVGALDSAEALEIRRSNNSIANNFGHTKFMGNHKGRGTNPIVKDPFKDADDPNIGVVEQIGTKNPSAAHFDGEYKKRRLTYLCDHLSPSITTRKTLQKCTRALRHQMILVLRGGVLQVVGPG